MLCSCAIRDALPPSSTCQSAPLLLPFPFFSLTPHSSTTPLPRTLFPLSMAADAFKSTDGSYIGVQTNQGAYNAGETIHGYVVAQLFSPRQVDRVLVVVTCKEKVYWDEEISRTVTREISPGEQAAFQARAAGMSDAQKAMAVIEETNKRTSTVYEHHRHEGKVSYLKEMVVASATPHVLAAGSYSYPFSYTLRRDLPGCARYSKESEASDPAWRSSGRKLQVRAEVSYKIKAFLDVNGVFSRDLRSKQEVTVNSAFDWNAMKPAFGEKSGQVLLCCCVPRGEVTLSASFDRAAYTSGETAQIKAAINNQSEQDVKQMVVKLM